MKKKFKWKTKLSRNKKPSDPQIVEVIQIDDTHGNITCNINDFIGWCEDLKVIRKSTLKKIDSYANFFVAYHSYIIMTGKKDTPEYRKEWFNKHRSDLIINSMLKSGL